MGEDGFLHPDRVYKGLLTQTLPADLKKLSSCSRDFCRSRAAATKKRVVSLCISAPAPVEASSSQEPSSAIQKAYYVFRDALIEEVREKMSCSEGNVCQRDNNLRIIPGDLAGRSRPAMEMKGAALSQPAYFFVHVFPGDTCYVSYDGLDIVARVLAGLYLEAAEATGCANVVNWKPFN
jgi:hypothetical protein